ncbi:MAG: 8-amino-7-oxononanoate synthase [Pseudomonadota bacterium]
MNGRVEDYWHTVMSKIDGSGLRRELRDFSLGSSQVLFDSDNPMMNLASNNYLGLANDPRVCERAIAGIKEFGLGAGSARFLAGNFREHVELEHVLSQLHGTEAALVFSSGYTANLATLSAILGPRDTAFCDALSHASLVEGCRVVHSTVRLFRHNDMDHLETLLREHRDRGKKVIVTDGVFSMDGEFAPLRDLVFLAEKYGAVLVVDDAHANGTVGPHGSGTAAHFGLVDKVPVQIGTLSKAFGSQGGYLVGSKNLIDTVMHRGKAFLHSTALAPALASGALEAIQISIREPERRKALIANVSFLRSELAELGLKVLGDEGAPLLSVQYGSTDASQKAAKSLEAADIFAPAIRPPTVPKGTCRVRLAPMALHTTGDMQRVVSALSAL